MITVESLCKSYGSKQVLDNVSFDCQPGTVTGFLGSNGAGKSTTMRIICGLSNADSGSACVSGLSYAQIPNPGREVGVMLDASAIHPGRTGRETLRIVAETMGVKRSTADQLLEQVGLADAATKVVRDYSLGMRQRLGIASALVGQPRTLILDEPANGLDPQGILWMRELLKGFAERGGTVLLSSHLLSEIEQIADRLVVIADGSLAFAGAQSELLQSARVRVCSSNDKLLAQFLEFSSMNVIHDADGALLVDGEPGAISQLAATKGIVLFELTKSRGSSLEDVFLRMTKR